MDYEGYDPPTLEEVFEEVEKDREELHIDNVTLRVIVKRQKRQIAELEAGVAEGARSALLVESLESRVAELEIALEEARSAMSDTATGDGVGSGRPSAGPD